MMISTELVDADNGGEENDIKVGIWINKIRCEFEGKAYHIVTDWGQHLQNGFSVAGTSGQHVLLRNVADYQKNPYYYEEISTYRGTTKSYPEVQGYVFAGWYADAEYKTAIEPDVTSGSAWAKFAAEDVLSVKAQVKLDSNNALPTTSTDLRFVTTVDNLDYRRISFYIEKTGGKGEIDAAGYDQNPRLVYEKLYYVGNNSKTMEHVPSVFSWQSVYFKAFTIKNIPYSDYSQTIKVTPYWITMDGTVVRGKGSVTCVAQYNMNTSQAVSVNYIGKDTMPITGFSGPYPVSDANDAKLFPDYVTDEYFKLIADSGVNAVPSDLLWKNCPEEEKGNFDYLVDVIDWDKNVDPDFHKNRFMAPKVITENEEYTEEWICYKCKEVSAKRLTVQPGKTVTIKDAAAYGFILLQGKGKFGIWEIETPTLIRYGELTNDEFFVTEKAAKEGIVITNTSSTEPIVMLKHFAENPELELE